MDKLKKPKVLVLMAAYNGENFIRQQIDSILNQDAISVNLLIRDDGSTDNTILICKNYLNDRRVKIILDGDKTGTPAGCFYKLIMNEECSESYDYFAFSDQDDIWGYEKIISAINEIINGYSAYSSNLTAFNFEDSKAWVVSKKNKQTKYDYIFQGASAGCTYVLDGAAMRAVIETVSKLSFNELKYVSHDWFIYAIVRSSGLKWKHCSQSYIFYRQHANNNYGDVTGVGLLIKKWNLLKSGWYGREVRYIVNNINQNNDVEFIKNSIIFASLFKKIINFKVFIKLRRSKTEGIAVFIISILKLI